jgi:hypothetical protein
LKDRRAFWGAPEFSFPNVHAIAQPAIGFIQDYLVLESKASPFREEMGRSEKDLGRVAVLTLAA